MSLDDVLPMTGTMSGRGSASRELPFQPLAHLYVSDAAGALRTLLGDSHRHVIGSYPSWKTRLSQPFEGLGEQALIEESELLYDVVDYQTQAFRKRLMLGTAAVEWIVDHLRQLRDGTVEAIEVKQHPSQMTPEYVAKLQRARQILADALGWRLRVRYEAEIIGEAQWQRNRGHILAHRSAHVSAKQHSTLARMLRHSPRTTYGEVRDAMDARRVQGDAVVHALICAGRVVVDLQKPLRDGSPVTLLPEFRFNSKIRF